MKRQRNQRSGLKFLGRHIIACMMMKLQSGRRLRNLKNSLDVAYSVVRHRSPTEERGDRETP
jgi:hypothetical protein